MAEKKLQISQEDIMQLLDNLFFSVCCLYSFHFVPLFVENNLAGCIFHDNQLLS